MTVAELADAVLNRPALVFGSLPPDGRDLDLLLRGGQEEVLAEVLHANGYIRSHRVWVRPAIPGGEADAVELVAAGEWGLPDHALDDLFARAIPIEGLRHLVRPAPHHALLILARRVARGDGALDERRRVRLDSALAQEPRAWDLARETAPAWGATQALDQLQAVSRTGRSAPRRDRIVAVAEPHVDAGDGRALAAVRASVAVLRGHRRGALVAISAPNASHAAAHAGALRATLVAAGHPSVTIGAPGEADGDTGSRAFSIRQAATEALRLRAESRPHLRAGVAVVSAVSAVDLNVRLREQLGPDRRLFWQRRLVRFLAGRPAVTVVLDGPAQGREVLYRGEASTTSSFLVSADAPSELVAREIALHVLPTVLHGHGTLGPWARARAKSLYHLLARRRRVALPEN